jgi:hypothetical protein
MSSYADFEEHEEDGENDLLDDFYEDGELEDEMEDFMIRCRRHMLTVPTEPPDAPMKPRPSSRASMYLGDNHFAVMHNTRPSSVRGAPTRRAF